jgi:hypothetical protein
MSGPIVRRINNAEFIHGNNMAFLITMCQDLIQTLEALTCDTERPPLSFSRLLL